MAKKAIKLERLKMEVVDVTAVHPNDYNPNRQTARQFETLCQSIRDEGFTIPILIHKDGTIIDGEHRWRAAQEVGLTKILAVYMPESMSEEQARIMTLRMNRARGTDNQELLAPLLRDMEKLGALDKMQDALGFSDSELQAIFGQGDTARKILDLCREAL